MMIIPQSDIVAWRAARLGKVTASRLGDMMARTKSGWGTSRENYLAELIVERLTNQPGGSGFISAPMQWGLDHEAEAREMYAFVSDCEVGPGGFINHPSIEYAGASPDGFRADGGLCEFKCPNTATQIERAIAHKRGTISISKAYQEQVQFQMACAKASFIDFVSFDPRLPAPHNFICWRILRDPIKQAEIEKEIRAFLLEVDQRLEELR